MSARRPQPLDLIVVVAAVVTAAGLAMLWPTDAALPPLSPLGVTSEVYEATVFETVIEPCTGTTAADGISCRIVGFQLTQGPDAGTLFVQEFPLLSTSPDFEVGERVVLNRIPQAAPGFEYQYADRQRRGLLAVVAAVFAVAVIALGRRKGAAALVGLAASVAVLIMFVVPALLAGSPPLAVALVGASTIAFLALYSAHGLKPSTSVALLGTLGALALTALLSAVTVAAARFSGFTTEESLLLSLVPGGIDPRGLLLAGVVLGALGALDDVTVTQVSAVAEIRAANPSLSTGELWKAGLRVGRDHIASTVNTLLLAYAGASMPLLVLFVLSRQSLGAIANSEVVATEIVRTLVGSIGLVAAVPITTWLAVRISPSKDDVSAMDDQK